MQPAPNQIDVVQAGDDGECECGAEKCLLSDPDPFHVVNLQQHDKYNSRQLGERICFAEDAGAKITQPGNCVQNCADEKNANVTAEDHHRKLPGYFVNDGKHEEDSAQQELVGDGVEVLSEERLLFEAAGEQAIQAVAYAGQHK